MDKLVLFHGTTERTLVPQFGKGKTNNDYGLGFYCTPDIELAKEWACRYGSDGLVYEYTLDPNGLNILRLDRRPYNYLNWLALLVENRKFPTKTQIQKKSKDFLLGRFLIDVSAFDVIIGYRADDSYFEFGQSFLSNSLSLNELKRGMKLGNMGNQVVIKSRTAFDRLRYSATHQANMNTYWEKYLERDRNARRALREQYGQNEKEIYINQIMEEEWDNDDTRLF